MTAIHRGAWRPIEVRFLTEPKAQHRFTTLEMESGKFTLLSVDFILGAGLASLGEAELGSGGSWVPIDHIDKVTILSAGHRLQHKQRGYL